MCQDNKLIQEVLSVENIKDDINSRLSELPGWFNDFNAKYEMANSDLSVSRRNREVFLERIIQLDCNNLNKAQYN